jgi:transcriptional regulator with XRE-family HTH domain
MKTELRYGKKIQQFRQARAWTQEQLAEAAALDVRTVQRAEKDVTKNPETLQAIAGALDVDLVALRTAWSIAERKLVKTQLVTSAKDFGAAEEQPRPSHAFARSILAPLKPEFEKKIADLEERVFADRELIERDEPDMWRCYVQSIQESLHELFASGFAFFLLDERRDLRLSTIGGIQPEQSFIENWAVRYFLLVPRHGCFNLDKDTPLHRFNEDCREAGNTLFRSIREGTGLHVYTNALCAMPEAGNEGSIRWCDTCFPVFHGGARIGFDYIEQVTGMNRIQLQAMCEAITGHPFLEGLA